MPSYRLMLIVSVLLMSGTITLGQSKTKLAFEKLLTEAPVGSSKAAKSLGAAGKLVADPSWYLRSETWEGTMLASLENLFNERNRAKKARGFKSFQSSVMRGGDEAQRMVVGIEGLDEINLVVTGVPDEIWGAATWGDAKLIERDGSVQRLCELKSKEVMAGRYSIDENMYSGVSSPMKINGVQFDHGVHVYAHSRIRVPLKGKYVRFEASIGVDDWVGDHGAVRFEVTDGAGGARFDLWQLLYRDFAEEGPRRQMQWTREDGIYDFDVWPVDLEVELAARYGRGAYRVDALAARVKGLIDADRARGLYYRSRALDEAWGRAKALKVEALRLAIDDLAKNSKPGQYAGAVKYRERLGAIESALAKKMAEVGDFIATSSIQTAERVASLVADFDLLRDEALLANPLMDFDELMLIRRTPEGDPRRAVGTGKGVAQFIGLPMQSSKCNPNIERVTGWDNEIAVLSPVRPGGKLKTMFKPGGGELLTDVDLDFDGEKVAFSMPGTYDKWQIFEVDSDGSGLRQVTPGDQPDVHNYDACYLPNGQMAFVSTAPLQGVPCNAGVIVGTMFLMNRDGTDIHQVGFEQDHDYNPTVMNDGRVLYLRWDYTDTPHVWNRMLFTMNPDGTGQREYYGANSYWPNSIFYSRPIPDHPTQVVGIVTGHHVGRVGELVIFDPAKGRHEADGVVQRIPGYGEKVEPLIQDKLTEHSWPKFTHPYPLSDKYFLVASKPTPQSLWGIYLVDIFDNMVLLKEVEGEALLEPLPLRRTTRPPVIPSRVKPDTQEAYVYLSDVYRGPGMKGVPRGTIKELRVFAYHFAYQKQAGIRDRVGTDGPWEVKKVLGTVPVQEDGSAWFKVPAKTPLTVQPLGEDGSAVQLMRSWMTAMPGETLSCAGCHDNRNGAPPNQATMALEGAPTEITPVQESVRGFDFAHDVQPVLDRYCIGCHKEDSVEPNLRGDQDLLIAYKHGNPVAEHFKQSDKEELMGDYHAIFNPSYLALRRFVRVGGLESDLHLLKPMEFNANTSELIQMLRKGHYNVQLDRNAWDRLYTWIDLNAPAQGTWSQFTPIKDDQRERRQELRRLYGGIDEDGEANPVGRLSKATRPVETIMPEPLEEKRTEAPVVAGWPFGKEEAARRQLGAGERMRVLDLGGGVNLRMVKIPAGSFVMGDGTDGADGLDAQPRGVVRIEKDFWMSEFEVTNEQYARFNAAHESRFEHRTSWIFSEEYLGWPLDGAKQPVVRVSWEQSVAFGKWLSQKVGASIALPTEAQWEYAARAGSDEAMSYGDLDVDFSTHANMADVTIRDLAYWAWRPKPPDLTPRDDRFDDGVLVTENVGAYAPNAWGLYDMHGNAAEWTRSAYRAYPYNAQDGRNALKAGGEKVVRGGSWFDRPKRCRSAFRLGFPSWQPIHNVGFRVVMEESQLGRATARK